MSKKTADSVIEHRRERVAFYLARNYTVRAIEAQLADDGETNPETNTPWSRGTIGTDVVQVRALWKRQVKEAGDTHRARQVAELQAVRAAAWDGAANVRVVAALLEAMSDTEAGVRVEAARALGRLSGINYTAILQSLNQEADLLGTKAPAKVAPVTPGGDKPYDQGLTDEERLGRIMGLLDTARTRRTQPVGGSDSSDLS